MLHKPFRPPLLQRRPSEAGPPEKRRKISNENTRSSSISTSTSKDAIRHSSLSEPQPTIPPTISRKPLLTLPNASYSTQSSSFAATKPVDTSLEGYYTVLWRKPTANRNKKHKTWDGDGVLSVRDGFATLHDVSGRGLGRTRWTAALLPGSVLVVAGRDVEVEGLVAKVDFLAGKCFAGGNGKKEDEKSKETMPKMLKEKEESNASNGKDSRVTISIPTKVIPKQRQRQRQSPSPSPSPNLKLNSSSKPTPRPFVPPKRFPTSQFKTPLLVGLPKMDLGMPTRAVVPKHDPNTEGALVMTRPKSAPNGKQIVDVVVDPLLSKHLRDHQREGVKFLYECVMGLRMTEGQGAILADEMGLGKTLQTIALIWTLLKQNPIFEDAPVIRKALIVCPVTVITNWRKEFRKWLGNDRIGVLVMDDNKKTRITDFTKGKAYSILIMGYEKFRTVQDELKHVDIVVADEGHKLKTAQNKAALAIRSLNTDRRIVLSGTPMENNLNELYCVVDMVNPGLLGKYNAFKKNFETPIVRSRQPDATQNTVEKGDACNEELVSITSLFMLRRSADVIAKYLPPKTETIVFCRPTATQAAIYRAVLRSPIFTAVLGSSSSEASFQLINILKKLCNSPTLFLKSMGDETSQTEMTASLLDSIPPELARVTPASSTKLRILDCLLHQLKQETDEKVVIVSNYTSTLDMIGRLLTSLSYPFLRLDGTTPPSKRQELVDRFNRSSANNQFAFLLSAKAGGIGINLIGASRLVLFDTDWNPATDLQSMARIHRDGQKRPCHIYRLLVRGALDEKIFQRQIAKRGLADAVVDAKSTLQGFSTDELRDLFRLDDGDDGGGGGGGGGCPTHELLACGCEGEGNANLLLLPDGREERHGDAAADDDDSFGSDESLPELGALISASQVNMEEQERRLQKMRRHGDDRVDKKKNGKKKEKKMLALMQYLHIDAEKIRSGQVEDLESLVEDQILLRVLKQRDSKIAYIFARTSG